MKKLSKAFMTIALAGSFLFSTVIVSSAELKVSREGEQSKALDDLLNDPWGGDGEPDPLQFIAKGLS